MSDEDFNDGHVVEALQTLSIAIGIVESCITGDGEEPYHPAIEQAGARDEMQTVIRGLSESYQKVGQLLAN